MNDWDDLQTFTDTVSRKGAGIAWERVRAKIASLESKLAIAKEALRWYAIDDNPAGCQTARNALSKLNEEVKE